MKLPRVRFTVRRMMVAVAIVAIAVYGLVLWGESAEYRRLAQAAEARERLLDDAAGRIEMLNDAMSENIGSLSRMMQGPFNAAQADANDAFLERQRADIDRTRLNVIRYRRQRDYHASLKQKYLLASCRPWLPVAPDPPEPE